MATKKAGGTAKNLRDSNPKYLGVKRADGDVVRTGEVIVRQRGTKVLAGKNAGLGKDHTIFAQANGKVAFRSARKTRFDGHIITHKVVDIIPHAA
jgi:large subunit ribosomal protein L27